MSTQPALTIIHPVTRSSYFRTDTPRQTSTPLIFHDKLPADLLNTGPRFDKLESAKVVEAYQSSRNRVFILDYGGTLRENEALSKYIKSDINPCHKGRKLPALVQASFEKLSADPANQV